MANDIRTYLTPLLTGHGLITKRGKLIICRTKKQGPFKHNQTIALNAAKPRKRFDLWRKANSGDRKLMFIPPEREAGGQETPAIFVPAMHLGSFPVFFHFSAIGSA